MDEEKIKQEPEIAISNIGEGSEPKTTTLVDDTNLAAKRMEEATKAAKEERLAAEESYAKRVLGGRAEAGATPVKKEETPKDYAARVMAGDL